MDKCNLYIFSRLHMECFAHLKHKDSKRLIWMAYSIVTKVQ